jgi:hypothetical protein
VSAKLGSRQNGADAGAGTGAVRASPHHCRVGGGRGGCTRANATSSPLSVEALGSARLVAGEGPPLSRLVAWSAVAVRRLQCGGCSAAVAVRRGRGPPTSPHKSVSVSGFTNPYPHLLVEALVAAGPVQLRFRHAQHALLPRRHVGVARVKRRAEHRRAGALTGQVAAPHGDVAVENHLRRRRGDGGTQPEGRLSNIPVVESSAGRRPVGTGRDAVCPTVRAREAGASKARTFAAKEKQPSSLPTHATPSPSPQALL